MNHIEVLLRRNHGDAYNVPLWDRTTGNVIDLQFGAKWGAGWTFWAADDWWTCADDEFVTYFGNE